MKHKILILLAGSILFFGAISMHSCRKDFGFKEFDNLSDSLHLSGAIAIPLVNTTLTLKKYLPPNDSSLWAEIDGNDLIHLKMYYENMITIKMTDIFDDTAFPIAEGYLVPRDSVIVTQSDTSSMKLYDKMFEGNLFFNDPRIIFTIKNNIPLATFFRLDTLMFHDAEGNELSHNDNVGYDIDAPTVIGETVYDTIHISKTVMPILPAAFSPVPRSISFEYSAGSHNDQTLPFDVTGNEEMHIDVEVDLPLDVRLTTIELADTIPLPGEWLENNVEQVKEATLKMFFTNAFPVDFRVQVYFADTLANGGVGDYIDSIFTESGAGGWHLEAAQVDAAGKVTIPNETQPIMVTLNQERLKKLADIHASKIVVVGKLNTSNPESGNFVRIEGRNGLSLKMGVMAKYEGNTNDDISK